MTTDLELYPSEARRLVLGMIFRQPEDQWSPYRLASTLGLPTSAVTRALDELAQAGLVTRIDDEYVPGISLD
ncbi:MAG: MarR family transcriptional regulator [Actinomycetota bacterium]